MYWLKKIYLPSILPTSHVLSLQMTDTLCFLSTTDFVLCCLYLFPKLSEPVLWPLAAASKHCSTHRKRKGKKLEKLLQKGPCNFFSVFYNVSSIRTPSPIIDWMHSRGFLTSDTHFFLLRYELWIVIKLKITKTNILCIFIYLHFVVSDPTNTKHKYSIS